MNMEDKYFSIKNWAEDDKPREKLALKGKAALSDAELLAILIGSGSRNESAVALCKRILATNENNLNQLGKQTIQQLLQFKGIGEAKAITILAALELGKRRRIEDAKQFIKIACIKDIFEVMQPLIGDLSNEEFWVILLNNNNKIIQKIQLSKGGLTSTIVDIRLLFKQALEFFATAIILVHNHPSGQLKPSESDRSITKKIKEAGNVLEIKILDHVIITEFEYFSFADNDIL